MRPRHFSMFDIADALWCVPGLLAILLLAALARLLGRDWPPDSP